MTSFGSSIDLLKDRWGCFPPQGWGTPHVHRLSSFGLFCRKVILVTYFYINIITTTSSIPNTTYAPPSSCFIVRFFYYCIFGLHSLYFVCACVVCWLYHVHGRNTSGSALSTVIEKLQGEWLCVLWLFLCCVLVECLIGEQYYLTDWLDWLTVIVSMSEFLGSILNLIFL